MLSLGTGSWSLFSLKSSLWIPAVSSDIISLSRLPLCSESEGGTRERERVSSLGFEEVGA